MLKQDDPRKCTAQRLLKFNLAKVARRPQRNAIILNPFASQFLLPNDKKISKSIIAVDCSWNLANDAFFKRYRGFSRKLPPLLAGNPVNYSKLNQLTTVEAVSAALYILGEKKSCLMLLDKFRWGHTFYELNSNLLEEYSKITSESEIVAILQDYGFRFQRNTQI